MSATLPSPERPLRIGTRGSPLAVAQAEETRARLMAAHGLAEDAFEIVRIRTTGDAVQDRALSAIGGKGLFTLEIEKALIEGADGAEGVDIAVHSMKDMPTVLPEGLAIVALLPREDVRDAFVSHRFEGIGAMPAGTVVGTSSLRRKAQLLNRRPDLEVVEFRGTVNTRLRKLEEGVAAATFLACAGLKRLDMGQVIRSAIAPEEMLPAVAQGAIGIEAREGDAAVAALLAPI
ncbi:MAG: hydroxymethylbilane synthase, partial [Pseudomonadota bacterium]